MSNKIGIQMHDWAKDLFPICRSITGEGVRQTLEYFKEILPNLEIHSVATGTKVFDWEVPQEWNIKDAYIKTLEGERIVDFNISNLHVVGYSTPIDKVMKFEELDEHIYSLPEQPDAIPYITSYYKSRWGFCMSHNQRMELLKKPDQEYHVKIDSSLKNGVLNYGELLIKGKTDDEILLSTYICHPSMANNELSGPCVAAAIAKYIQEEMKDRHYTYRILFLVETIGSITYLSQNLHHLKKHVKAGYVMSCIGDERNYSYIETRDANTLSDKAAKHVLNHIHKDFILYSYVDRGSDERQYCSPGVDLPIGSVCRSLHGAFPEYHTSLDDLTLVTPKGLEGGFIAYKEIINILEHNKTYRTTVKCEPQLGKRGLYPNLSTKTSGDQVRDLRNLLAYSDGNKDLIEVSNTIGVYAGTLIPIIKKLMEHELLEIVN